MLGSHEELYRWFTQQVAKNLHVVFTMNPPEDGLASRAATSPALFGSTAGSTASGPAIPVLMCSVTAGHIRSRLVGFVRALPYWFAFLSSIAFLPFALRAISK
jgi:hypothetical protein